MHGFSQKKNPLDSLWGAFNDPKYSDSLRINAIHTITIKLSYVNPDSGLKVGTVYLDYIGRRKLDKSYAAAYNAVGTCYLNKGNLDSALVNFEKSLAYRQKHKDKKGEASALNNVGIVYYQRGDYSRCLEYYQKSLTIKDSLGDKTGVASSYSNIGMINDIEGNHDKALMYYRKSLHLRDSLGDLRGMGDSYLKIGGYYFDISQYDSSIYYVHKGIYYAQQAGDSRTAVTGIINLGNIFQQYLKPDSAFYYFNMALRMHEEIGNDEGIAMAQKDIGRFYVWQENYSEAIKYCDSSLKITQALGFTDLQLDACECLAEAYDALNQPAKALYYYKVADTLRDSLSSVEKTKALNRKSLQYEFEKDKLADSLRVQKEAALKDAQHEQDLQKQTMYSTAGIAGFLIMVIIAFIIFRGYKQKQENNRELEKKNILIEEKQKAILDSITYAKRLQEAILPSIDTVNKFLPSNFILYKPKDIVAGDFYWMEHSNGYTFIAAADCTGHGVPGAMVSVVCSNALNRSVLEFRLTDPGKILDRTRELVLETFSKSDKDVYDGMDISLVAIREGELKWAGANNPLWIIHNEQLSEIKPDKQSIGKEEFPKPFNTVSLALKKNSRIYLLTDGYADQFGGPHGKKFKYKQLEQLLISTSTLSIPEQGKAVEKVFEDWKGHLEQIDDVCLIGIEIP